MKKLLNIFSALIIGGMVASCEDVLEAPTQSSFDETIVFSNHTLAEQAVFGIYAVFGETNAHRSRYSAYYGLNTDIEWSNSSGNPNSGDSPSESQELYGYITPPSSQPMNTISGGFPNNSWAMIYKGIERANVAIQGLRNYGNVESDAVMASLLGEAITMRAVLYHDLLRAWGDLPARFEPVTTNTIYLEKSDRDEIYKRLLSDLEEAAVLVPWPNEASQTSTVERVNKAFVKGLYARLALWASGYSQRPVDLNSGNGQSIIRLSEDPELSKAVLYPKALAALEEVIESGTVRLESNFVDVWKYNMQDGVAAGRESMFEIPYSNSRGRWMYTWAIPHRTTDKYTLNTNGGSGGPVPYLFFDFDQEDSRRDVSCVPYQWRNGAQTLERGTSEISAPSVNTWYFGKYRFEWMARQASAGTDHGINPVYMRYPDVLLMAAECANELGDLEKAKDYFEEVRSRAYPDNAEMVDAYMNSITSKELMFEAIVDERAFEFVGEFLRKSDLIRWNLLGSKMAEAKDKMYQLARLEGSYADLSGTIYYRLKEDGESLEIYGLNRGETDAPDGTDWTSESYISEGKLGPEKVEGLYWRNPDSYQYWPIFQVDLDASAGYLVNDYAY